RTTSPRTTALSATKHSPTCRMRITLPGRVNLPPILAKTVSQSRAKRRAKCRDILARVARLALRRPRVSPISLPSFCSDSEEWGRADPVHLRGGNGGRDDLDDPDDLHRPGNEVPRPPPGVLRGVDLAVRHRLGDEQPVRRS